jgi:phosphatidylglycerol lysyltransferase
MSASFSAPRIQPNLWAKWVALLVGLAGLLHLYVALFPPQNWVAEQMEDWTPFHIAIESQGLLVLSACGQLALGRGLWRRKSTAWWGTLIVLMVTPVLHVGRDFEWSHAVASLIPLGVLLVHREYFSARSDRSSVRWAWIIGVPIFAALVAFGFVIVRHFGVDAEGNHSLVSTLQAVLELVFLQSTDTLRATTTQAHTAFLAVSFAGAVFGLVLLGLVLRPVFPDRPPSPVERERVRRLVEEHGDNPFDEFALGSDKHYFFSTTNRSVVVFALWRNYALTLSDPIGPLAERAMVASEFVNYCADQDWEPVFYEVGPDLLPVYEHLGFNVRKIGEQTRIPLVDYALTGPKFQKLRASSYRAAREGYTFRWYAGDGAINSKIEASMERVSDAWLKAKNGREMTFDMSGFDIDEIRLRGAAIALNPQGKVEAFATWLPYRQGKGRCLDLMRNSSTVHGLMDFVIVESIRTFREQGLEEVSLANAPLANTAPPDNTHDRAIRYIYENFNRLYGYRTLFEFKKKYLPVWRGSYLAYRSTAKLPWISYAMVSIHVPGGLLKLLRS